MLTTWDAGGAQKRPPSEVSHLRPVGRDGSRNQSRGIPSRSSERGSVLLSLVSDRLSVYGSVQPGRRHAASERGILLSFLLTL